MTKEPDYKRMWTNLETRVANEKDNLELKDYLSSCLDEIKQDEDRASEREDSLMRLRRDFRSLLGVSIKSIVQRPYTPTGKSKVVMATDVNFAQVTGRYDRLRKEDVQVILKEEFERWFNNL